MKTLLRILGAVLGLVVLAAVAGLAYLFLAFPKVPPPSAVKVEVTPERLARGAYLSEHLSPCVACHSTRDFSRFAGPVSAAAFGQGGDRFDAEHDNVPGVLYAKNITPARLASWTDGELIRAVTAGVSRDGTPLFPLMPYQRFGRMSEEDVHAIVAYVRNLKSIEHAVPERSLTFPMNLITRIIPAPAAFVKMPPPADKVAYGGYLVNAAACTDCHTPIDQRGQPLPGKNFAGGTRFRLPPSNYRVVSANITPDADTGIGSWTEQQFIDKFKGFESPADHVLTDVEQRQNTVMPWTQYAGITREDLGAIYAYLRTLPPVINRVNKHPDATAQ